MEPADLNEKTKFIIDQLKKADIWISVDESLYDILNELNSLKGITSDVCCEGHGSHYPYIYFTIAPDTDSFKSLSVIEYACRTIEWTVNLQSVSKQLYFVMIPFESFKNARTNSFIKIPVSDTYTEEKKLYEFKKLAETIRKVKKSDSLGLRKPLFKIPDNI